MTLATMNRHSLPGVVRRLAAVVADMVAPRYCEQCRRRLAVGERLFCTTCVMLLPRTGDELSPADNPAVRKLWGRVKVERGVSFAVYTPHVSFAPAVYAMKYGDRPDIADDFGRFIASELGASGLFDDIDVIVPMPLHRRRERERGYNQSTELARGISRVTGIPVCDDAVARTRYTPSQTTLSSDARASNVDGAFSLVRPERIKGRHVLLVDDIITTGASMAACAAVMARGGDITLSFLTVGRTADF